MVDFVPDYIDEGAPEFCVNGVACIQYISDGQVMITYFKRRNDEMIAVARLIWDRKDWLRMWDMWDEKRAAIYRERFGKSAEQRQEMH